MTEPTLDQVVTNVSTTSGTNTLPLVFTGALTAGQVIFLATNRGASAGSTNGISSVTGGAITWAAVSNSGRAGAHDTALWVGLVNSNIAANLSITITWLSNSSRRNAVAGVFSHITSSAFETASTSNPGQDGGTSYGANGSSTSMSVSATSANVTTDIITVGAMSLQGTTALTPGTGFSEAGEIRTSVGSSDRGVALIYKAAHFVSGTQAATASLSATQAWAAAMGTFKIEAVPVTPGATGKVVVGGVKKSVANRYVIVGGVKKPVVNRYVIVGGVKKPVV